MSDLAAIAPAASARSHRSNITVPDALSAQLRDDTDLRHAAHAALLPYHMSLKETESGIEVSGDAPAVVVIQRWLEQAAINWSTIEPHEAPDIASLHTAVHGALKRDLVLRLAGLPKPVRPLTLTQHAYIETMIEGQASLILASGPTGTGKTHLALAAGLSLLESGAVRHLIVACPDAPSTSQSTRSDVQPEQIFDRRFAGIEDELIDLVGPEEMRRLLDERRLDICPIDQLRGRTFRETFLVIDGAQNMDISRTRMVVSRLGENSRMVLIGDPDQCELRLGRPSGFNHLIEMVDGEDFAKIIRFDVPDIIRNPVVARLEALYARDPGNSVEHRK
jgi:phosphate starvation-inducible protein PhoH and related proteins